MLQKFETYQLAKRLYRVVQGYPGRSFIRDQVQRACLSVVLNLAEGSAKVSEKERKRFYGISLASLREIQAVFDVAGCTEEAWRLADRVGAMLYRLVKGRY